MRKFRKKGGAEAVCEVMERYQAEAVKKAERETGIRTTVEEAIEYEVSEEKTVKRLMKKYQMSEAEATEQYEKYAPALV